ncbi:MAG: NADP-dependent phosphogluconate dehydrogenase [Syntrophothermus sp.]
MNDEKYDIGMIGLGTMGRNLVLNISDKGYSAAGFDLDFSKLNMLRDEAGNRKILAVKSMNELVMSLKQPRIIIMLVPAGPPVDSVITDLRPALQSGDILVDGGNSHYIDTDRRIMELAPDNIRFMGVGISGGEKGARLGPSIMPGGSETGYVHLRSIFQAIAARVDNTPCCAWLGPGSAGHYVKMVHNGIEYGIIELIAESYHLMKHCLGLTEDELHEVYSRWDSRELKSYLIEITADIFLQKDEFSEGRLINLIQDCAHQKGTGKWTTQDAMDLQIPIPVIDSSVMMRDMSARKNERIAASRIIKGPDPSFDGGRNSFINKLGNALFFGMITAYAQGFALMHAASESNGFNLRFDTIAQIWRGGCIIRAEMLNNIYAAFSKNNDLPNLLTDEYFVRETSARQKDLREVIKIGVDAGIPVPAFSSALTYFDSYRSSWLPGNLVQAQRDYFGSHQYERIDRGGMFHTQWNEGRG